MYKLGFGCSWAAFSICRSIQLKVGQRNQLKHACFHIWKLRLNNRKGNNCDYFTEEIVHSSPTPRHTHTHTQPPPPPPNTHTPSALTPTQISDFPENTQLPYNSHTINEQTFLCWLTLTAASWVLHSPGERSLVTAPSPAGSWGHWPPTAGSETTLRQQCRQCPAEKTEWHCWAMSAMPWEKTKWHCYQTKS